MALTLDDDLFPTVSKVLTVAELTRAIRGTLETKFGAVWVQGEISNYKLHPSGHQYFTLKDQRAQIACVIFRNTLSPRETPLVDGAQIKFTGTFLFLKRAANISSAFRFCRLAAPGFCRRNSMHSNASSRPKVSSLPRGSARCRNFQHGLALSRRLAARRSAIC